MDRITELKSRIFNKEKPLSDSDIIRIHHVMMVNYGWISLEEFKQLPLPTLWGLLNEIETDAKREKAETDKIKPKRHK